MAKVKSVNYVGKEQTYDLEVEHPDHQFYLSNGLLTSNSHAVAYSMNGYETAWYKTYYPAPFMAAMLKSEANSNGQDRELQIRTYKKETESLGISIVAPSINKSTEDFYAIDSKTIMTGLNAIKGIGEKAVRNIIEARNQHKFKNFHDFLFRTNSRYVRKDVIECLAKSGCLDEFGLTRKDMVELYAEVRKKINDFVKKNNQDGKNAWDILNNFEYLKYTNEEYSNRERLGGEKETLGEYVSGNINDVYSGFFKGDGIRLSSLKDMQNNQGVLLEAVIIDCGTGKYKNGANAGKVFGKFQVADQYNTTTFMTLWAEQYGEFKDIMQSGKPIRAQCKVNDWNGNKSLVFQKLISIGK